MVDSLNMKALLSRISYRTLVPITIVLALAPFVPEPHLVEKLRMLSEGTLSRPIDIFDLFFHSVGIVILLAKLIVDGLERRSPR